MNPIKKAIELSGVTNAELARRLNVSKQAIDEYIKAKTPKNDTIIKVCKALELNYFFDSITGEVRIYKTK